MLVLVLNYHTPALCSDCSEQWRWRVGERTEQRWKLEKDRDRKRNGRAPTEIRGREIDIEKGRREINKKTEKDRWRKNYDGGVCG